MSIQYDRQHTQEDVRHSISGQEMIAPPMRPPTLPPPQPPPTNRLAAVVASLTSAVHSGRISSECLRQSLRRIIALKVRMGLISLP